MMPASDHVAPGRRVGHARFHHRRRAGRQRVPGEHDHKNYGPADNVADWVALAQFVNYDGYRAMYEAQSKNRMGLLIWMSHPCWPSFVWQTYDYYFDPSAAYFGVRRGPSRCTSNGTRLTDTVEVVNYSAGAIRGLTARVQVLNMDGSVKWEKIRHAR